MAEPGQQPPRQGATGAPNVFGLTLLALLIIGLSLGRWVSTKESAPVGEAPATEGAAPRTGKHIAIAFYGLSRSLSYTIESIERQVFDVLRGAGHTFDVYLHTYDLESMVNPRNRKEGEAALNASEWKLLAPDAHSITHQEDFLDEYALQLHACKTFSLDDRQSASSVDIYRNNFTSIQNVMCQLNSLTEVTHLWRDSGKHYDAVAYMRPDVLYTCPFPVDALENLDSNAIVIPNNHHWGGLNDRFALGEPRTVQLWGERLYYALSTCMTKQLHSESLVKAALDHFDVAVRLVDFTFFRIRSSGALQYEDEFLPEAECPLHACNQSMIEEFEETWGRPWYARWKKREERAIKARAWRSNRDANLAAEALVAGADPSAVYEPKGPNCRL